MKTVLNLISAVIIGPLLALLVFGFTLEELEAPLPFYQTADFSPVWKKSELGKEAHRVGEFQLTDQAGRSVDNETVRGKLYVANFFFSTCPGVCPKMMGNLQEVQLAFAGDPGVMLLSHSVLPEVDSVQRLAEYAELMDMDSEQWRLLTGNAEEIYRLGRLSYFAEKPGQYTEVDEFLHSELVLLVDGEGHLRGVYNGLLPLEMNRLIEDIRLLKGQI